MCFRTSQSINTPRIRNCKVQLNSKTQNRSCGECVSVPSMWPSLIHCKRMALSDTSTYKWLKMKCVSGIIQYFSQGCLYCFMIKDRGVMILQVHGSVHNSYFSIFLGWWVWNFWFLLNQLQFGISKTLKNIMKVLVFFPSAGKVKGVIPKARNNFAWKERNISLLPDYGLETEQKNRCFFYCGCNLWCC